MKCHLLAVFKGIVSQRPPNIAELHNQLSVLQVGTKTGPIQPLFLDRQIPENLLLDRQKFK